MELDEHVPVYVSEPKHRKYHVPSDDDMQVKDQPYDDDASPTAESPGYIVDSESMEEDSIDYQMSLRMTINISRRIPVRNISLGMTMRISRRIPVKSMSRG
nr:hypothetical protein [Tanacetum cinerariifolium]